jgi:hypothetical protein
LSICPGPRSKDLGYTKIAGGGTDHEALGRLRFEFRTIMFGAAWSHTTIDDYRASGTKTSHQFTDLPL